MNGLTYNEMIEKFLQHGKNNASTRKFVFQERVPEPNNLKVTYPVYCTADLRNVCDPTKY